MNRPDGTTIGADWLLTATFPGQAPGLLSSTPSGTSAELESFNLSKAKASVALEWHIRLGCDPEAGKQVTTRMVVPPTPIAFAGYIIFQLAQQS